MHSICRELKHETTVVQSHNTQNEISFQYLEAYLCLSPWKVQILFRGLFHILRE